MSPCFCSTAAMLPKCKTELKCGIEFIERYIVSTAVISEQPANRLAAEDWPWARGLWTVLESAGVELWSRYWEEKRTRRVWSKYVEVWREIQTMPIFQAVRSPHHEHRNGSEGRGGCASTSYGITGVQVLVQQISNKKATEQGDLYEIWIAISGSEDPKYAWVA
ncbi:hypothetical protein BDZ89DRAFT_1045512 [Hymenopellis radicata]|nr:hypothetical protein BDZ89DRAFT_1049569 [Hymenopellis radicata]KAF9016840.1 hypothetical protein BDZ89DRAFT_1045512 [Hymenopellis radicata]